MAPTDISAHLPPDGSEAGSTRCDFRVTQHATSGGDYCEVRLRVGRGFALTCYPQHAADVAALADALEQAARGLRAFERVRQPEPVRSTATRLL